MVSLRLAWATAEFEVCALVRSYLEENQQEARDVAQWSGAGLAWLGSCVHSLIRVGSSDGDSVDRNALLD